MVRTAYADPPEVWVWLDGPAVENTRVAWLAFDVQQKAARRALGARLGARIARRNGTWR
jgi:hypothetical protein